MTTFVAFNKANVPDSEFQTMIAGVRCQLGKDFCPAWGLAGSTVRLGKLDEEDGLDGHQDIGVSVFKNPDVPDAGGYHDKDPKGRAYCRVFTEPYLANGGSWLEGSNSVSCAFSHEILEALRDPNAANWTLMSDGRLTADEVCDAVEELFYLSEGAAVSNFLLPRWSDDGSDGTFDFLGKLETPFSMSDGGYRLIVNSKGDVTNEWGSKFPDWKKELKIRSKRQLMRAWMQQISVFDPATAKLDPVADRFKARMLLREQAETGIVTRARPPTIGRSVTTVTGHKLGHASPPVNNSGQKLGKKVW